MLRKNMPLVFILIICVFVAAAMMKPVRAEVAWTCKKQITMQGNVVYGDCGYREITTIKLACQIQLFTDHMGREHEHLVCRNKDQFYVIADNVG